MRRGILVAMVATTMAGCGTGGEGGPAPRSAVEGIVGRQCRWAMEPGTAPSIRELTRVGTLGNISLWGRDLGPADTVELSVRYADDGRLEWVRAIRATLTPDRVVPLERLVFGALDDMARADWGVRVLVVAGDVVDVAPSVICEPERSAGAGIWANPPTNPQALRDFYLVRGRQVPVQVALDERGRVLDVRLLQSTYSRWVDQYILDFVRNSSFEPKLHDGLGVATAFEIRLRFPRR